MRILGHALLTIGFIGLHAPSSARASDAVKGSDPAAKAAEVEAVLEKLENRLMNQEAAQGEKHTKESATPETPPPASSPKKAVTRYQFPKSEVKGRVEESEKLKALGGEVENLGGDIENLAGQIQKTKQELLEGAALDNSVSIEAKLPDAARAALKNMTVKLDGQEVYAISDTAGLWIPGTVLPLHAGPMKPGTHRLEVETRLVLRHPGNAPMNGDVYRLAQKSFDLVIPAGKARRQFTLAIALPADGLGQLQLELEEQAEQPAPGASAKTPTTTTKE
jgi:hypothetical protein